MSHRLYQFTWNNYTEEDELYIKDIVAPKADYLVYGKEVAPTTGTPHLQGLVYFKNKKSFNSTRKLLKENHIEVGRSLEQLDHYNRKEGIITEYGVKPKQGNRNDITYLKELIYTEQLDYPEILDRAFELCAKYSKFIRECLILRDNSKVPKQELNELYPWEINLIQIIEKPPHDRQIFWVVDIVGGKGKSTFSRFLIDHYNAFYTNGGKWTDIIHAYNNEPVIIFDYVRASQEYVNYGVMEQFKNGTVFSPKYNSTMKRFPTPHVIAFSNFMPDTTQFSNDRLQIIQL